MKIFNISLRAEEVDLEQLSIFMKNNNIEIPKDFINFLVSYNIVYLNRTNIKVNSSIYLLQGFYPFSASKGFSNLQTVFEIAKGITDYRLLPFAYDPAGNWYLICIEKGDDFGKVYIQDFDSEEELELLFNNFNDFLDNLIEY